MLLLAHFIFYLLSFILVSLFYPTSSILNLISSFFHLPFYFFLLSKWSPTGLARGTSTRTPSYAKASEGYPPLAKSAEATSFNTCRVKARVTHSSTGRAHGLLRRRIKPNVEGNPTYSFNIGFHISLFLF